MDLQVVGPDGAESDGSVVMIGGPRATCGALRRGPFELVGAEVAQG